MGKRLIAALLAFLLLLTLPGCGGGKTASSSPTPEITFKPEDIEYSESMGMELDPETGKDKYDTEPVPEGMPLPVNVEDAVITDQEYHCTLSISCATILDNQDHCDPDKLELVPADGWILEPTEVVFFDGESVFTVLRRECRQRKIHMEFSGGKFGSAYIEGINNLYEKDVGDLSGWMYSVNGWYPNYGCSRYALKDGDMVEWRYTCNGGEDVGGAYALGGEYAQGEAADDEDAEEE